jgi:hypothetical protein
LAGAGKDEFLSFSQLAAMPWQASSRVAGGGAANANLPAAKEKASLFRKFKEIYAPSKT